MDNLNDNKLIKKIKNGDTYSLEVLIKKYMNLVKIMVRKSFLIGGEEEDLYQEGLMSIINAANQYDETKNSSFSVFVTTCIKRKIIDAIRTATRDKHKPLNEAYPLSEAKEVELANNNFQKTNSPIDNYLEREWMEDFHKKLKSILNPLQLEVIDLYFKGFSYAEIAQSASIPIKKVDNTLFAIKSKIRREFNDILIL